MEKLPETSLAFERGCCSLVVMVMDLWRRVISSNLLPLNTRRAEEPMFVKSLKAQTSTHCYRWIGFSVYSSHSTQHCCKVVCRLISSNP
ncbi:hypothetical protein TNCV_885121 [Trichonephila clavipes]|nr:hypothetical protein TNCV_885121 [Trichonephila clavipes]